LIAEIIAAAYVNLPTQSLGGMIGMMTLDANSELVWTVLVALTIIVCRPTSSPVFGFTSKRGKFELDTSIRIRCPFLKTLEVGHSGIEISTGSPGVKSSGSVQESR